MLLDALRWNMLNVIRVELFFNFYKLWDVFLHSSFKSPRSQCAIASFVISFLAQFTLQFNLSWFLTIYSLYLLVGVCVWMYRRVYFYHRRLDSVGVNQAINHFDSNKQIAATANGHHTESAYATLKKSLGSSSSSNQQYQSSNSGSPSSSADHTNSLQRQRVSSYRDFKSLLTEPRHNHREFALSLTHLSLFAKLIADEDVFDEMHFQILATRRDVVNILLRAVLIVASSLLVYMG